MTERILCFGIDVHADELVVRAADKASGKEIGPPLTVRNNRLGAEQLVTWLGQAAAQLGEGAICLEGGLEATGVLWLPLYPFLIQQAEQHHWPLKLVVFNPRLIAQWKKGMGLADDKDDPRDAGGLVERLCFGHLPDSYVPSAFWQGLRRLTRYRYHLAQELTREHARFLTHAFLKCSDWQRVKAFAEGWGATSAALLTQYSLQDLKSLSIPQLAEQVDRLSRHRFTDPEDVALKIQRALSQSYPVDPDLEQAVTDVLHLMLERIHDLNKRLQQVDRLIAQRLDHLPNPLRSVKGLGPVLSAGILAEIVDIQRFPDEADLAKYAGLVWPRHASGHWEAEDRRLAKAGDVYLRYYLGLGAYELSLYNDEYKAYYWRKYEESAKHKHKRALVLTSRKLVRLVYALLTKQQPFVARPAADRHPEVTDRPRAA